MADASNIRKVKFAKARNEELIEELRRLVAQAESGEICGVVAIKLRPDGKFAILRTGDCSDLELCGALAFATFDTIAANKADPE
jgi:hypothetical protein